MNGFSTRRLIVETWADAIAAEPARSRLVDELKRLLTPGVLEHLPEPLQIAPGAGAVALWVAGRGREAAVYTVRHAAQGHLIGLLILAEFADEGGGAAMHLGYPLAEPEWGKGYASELVAGLVDWLAEQGRPVTLLGGVANGNPASAAVPRKAGFKRSDALSDRDTDMYIHCPVQAAV
ncbi:GNAT family N-acetyltransferase [Defluviimonas salinarum]|uniref:GNAT family N-acetyltransferase n=1 Tax=Defluviimonas salinarum TaxID=2992147 RepID=A0ABT3IZ47_9RHOB|nr:GNAT family N-acetyltransferase [Defluviimonas salinarum]MCW3780698.1 GNAT family N-acetyltransferase [Defluviimonas salinarum]